MPRDPKLRVRDILDAVDRVRAAVEGTDQPAFCADAMRVRAVAFDLVVIGEAASQVPADIQAMAAAVPWSLMRGMRNKLAHEYYALSAEVVYETAKRDVPPTR